MTTEVTSYMMTFIILGVTLSDTTTPSRMAMRRITINSNLLQQGGCPDMVVSG
jgi:hypothetical protein